MRVVVTGASGFIGRPLCEALVRRGHEVVALSRSSSSDGGAIAFRGLEIGPETDWREILVGAAAVVHLAARVHVLEDRAAAAAYHALNAAATENLVRQAAAGGVRRFVLVSTAKIHGEVSVGHPIREDDPPAPVGPYAESKWAGEEAVRSVAGESGIEAVIVRPPLVYGPGVKANFLRLLRAVDRGMPFPLASVRNRRSLVFLGNLVDALTTCLEDPRAAGESFLVCDGDAVSSPELIRYLARPLGRSPRLLPVPPALLRLGGVVTGRSGAIERLIGSFELDCGRIRRTLEWRPPYSMEQGVEETVRWFRCQSMH